MRRVTGSLVAALFVVGGLGLVLSGSPLRPASSTWLAVGDLSTPRAGASAALLPGGRVLVAGGEGADGVTATVEVFAPEGVFSPVAAMNVARAGHTATVLADGRVLVAGGHDAAGASISSAEIYDPAADAWTEVAGGMLEPRAGHSATLLADRRVLIVGGATADAVSTTMEFFDPATNRFMAGGAMPFARRDHAAASLADGRVLIAGGFDGTQVLAASDIFDPATGSLVAGPDLSVARRGASATTLVNGQVLVAGGANDGGALASAELFDPAANSFALVDSALGAARQGHVAILLPHNNQVLIVGGTAGGNAVASAELFTPWDGTNGAFCSTAICASGYVGPAMPAAARIGAIGSALSFPASKENRFAESDGLALVVGGDGLKSADVYGFATVHTDKDDYAPGETVTITGRGWKPGEWIAIVLKESPNLDEHPLEIVQVDENGNFVSTEFKPDEHDLSVKFYLTAFGTESQAQTWFTDGVPTTTTLTSSLNPSFPGQSVTFTATVTANGAPTTTGSITFFDQTGLTSPNCNNKLGTPIGTAQAPNSSGQATVSRTFASAKQYAIRACYKGAGGNGTQDSDSPLAQTVNKGTPTLSVTTSPVTYTGTPQAASVVGSVAGTVSNVRYNGSPTTPIGAGTYAITADFAPTDSTNYVTLTATSAGNFVIGQAPSATAVTCPTNATYTGTALAPCTAKVTGAGGLDQSLTVTYVGNSSAGTATANASFAGDGNHEPSNDSKTFTIDKAASTTVVTCGAGPFTFTGSAQTPCTASVTGAGGLNESLAVSYQNNVNAGTATASASFAGDANHLASSGSKTFTIAKADATVSVTGFSGVYDGDPHGVVSSSATGVKGEALSGLAVDATTYTNVPGGLVHWTFSNANYKDQSGDATVTIAKADAVISVTGFSGVYDGDPHGVGSSSATGVKNEDLTGLVVDATTYTNVPGGLVHWTFSNANYKDQSGDATVTIAKADATVSVSGFNGTYDAAAHGATGTATGVGGVDLSAGLDLGAKFTDYPGGTTHWAFTGGTNYNDQNGDVTIVINKADATLLVNGYTGTYDAKAHGASLDHATGVGGADLSAGIKLGAAFTDAPGGTAHWTFDGGTNYNAQSGDVAITINKADATCGISGYMGVYDTKAHGASGSCSGIGGESGGALDLGASFTAPPGGTAHWVFTGNGNYNNQSGDAAIEISRANATCNVSGYTGVYDAAAHGASGSCSGIGGETAGALHLGDSFTNVPGGTAHWVFTGNANYNDQGGNVAVALSKANAICSVTGWTGVVDGAAHGASGTCKGVAGVDLSGGLNFGATFTNVPGGTAHWSFNGGTNYGDQNGDVTIDINYAASGLCLGSAGHSILQPVNADGTSVFKQKSTVPAKFRVCDAAGKSVGTPGVVTSFRLVGEGLGTITDVDEVVDSTTPDTSFRWSASDQQWIFNMSTKQLSANKTYVYRIVLNDGSTIDFRFGLK